MHAQRILSLGNFFGATHFFLLIYVLAPYLATFMPESSIGLVVSLGAVLTLSVFPFVPQIVRKYGPQQLALAFAALEFILLLWLALGTGPIAAILLAALACATSPLLAYQMDLLLEATVESEQETGRIRTAFLTAGNITLIGTPLLIGLLLDGSDRYDRVFFAAALSLIPFILLLLAKRLPRGRVPLARKVHEAWLCIFNDTDLRAIAISMFILQLFYHLTLFIPLFLHTSLGIPWSQLGWVFAVSLIPFVLVEYPAGILADTKLGDRTLLIVGFICTGIAFSLIAFVTAATPIFIILSILVFTRIGAALVEAMVEGHFFRRVSEEDASTVSVFRMMRPLGALIAPLIGSLFLAVSSYAAFFIACGMLVAVGGVLAALPVRSFRPARVSVHPDVSHL